MSKPYDKVERRIKGGSHGRTEIVATNYQHGGQGLWQRYDIYLARTKRRKQVADVYFQEGPVREAGRNGCSEEDLLLIVRDRLQSFQDGDFPCEQTQRACDHVTAALQSLAARTEDRKRRGVEGRSKA